MDYQRYRKLLAIPAGSLLLCFGGSVTAVAAFHNRFWPTWGGFVLFAAGYRVAQLGAHGPGRTNSSLHPALHVSPRHLARKYGLLAAGTGTAAYGGMIGAQAVETLAVPQMALAGICMSGGYVIGHIGLNNSYV
jgi:hypothetical protein